MISQLPISEMKYLGKDFVLKKLWHRDVMKQKKIWNEIIEEIIHMENYEKNIEQHSGNNHGTRN